jgi:hypothetical protein
MVPLPRAGEKNANPDPNDSWRCFALPFYGEPNMHPIGA